MTSQFPTSNYDALEEVLNWGAGADDSARASADCGGGCSDEPSGLTWLDDFIARHSLPVLRREPRNGGSRLILRECPFNPQHKATSAALFIGSDGKLGFKCQHNECSGKTWKDVREKFESIETRQAREQQSKPKEDVEVLSAAELITGHYPEPKPLIGGLLYPGIAVLQGAPKEGKSYLALQASIALVNERRLAGHFAIDNKQRVLYLALEDTKARTAKRLKELGSYTEHLRNLQFVYKLDPWPDNLIQLDNLLTERPTDVLVIDVLKKFRMGQKNGRDIVAADYAAIQAIRELVDKHTVTCLILNHTKKHAHGLSDIDASIDSTGLSAAIDALLTLRRRAEGTSMLSVIGRDVERGEYELEFNLAEGKGWRVLAAGAEAGLTVARRQIVELLKRVGPLSPKLIGERLGKNRVTVRRLVATMAKDGVLQVDADDNYSLTPEELAS